MVASPAKSDRCPRSFVKYCNVPNCFSGQHSHFEHKHALSRGITHPSISHTFSSFEQQLTCARHVLAGVRGAGDVGAYLELLKSAEMAGWEGDVDDAFDAACGGDPDDGDSYAEHGASVLSDLCDAAARVIRSSSQASPSPPSTQMCVLPHWPYAPRHLLCHHASLEDATLSSASSSCSPPPSPCYWLSLAASVRAVKDGSESDCVRACHINEAIGRWSGQLLASSSPSRSASVVSASLCTISHHVALEIYSNVSARHPLPPPTFFQLQTFAQFFRNPFDGPDPPHPSVIAAAVQRGFMGYVCVFLDASPNIINRFICRCWSDACLIVRAARRIRAHGRAQFQKLPNSLPLPPHSPPCPQTFFLSPNMFSAFFPFLFISSSAFATPLSGEGSTGDLFQIRVPLNSNFPPRTIMCGDRPRFYPPPPLDKLLMERLLAGAGL